MTIDNSPDAAAQPVNLTDRIPWQWYLVTAAVPVIGALIGFIAGIVFMARSKIGPALALWATSFLAALVWTTIGWLALFTWAAGTAQPKWRSALLRWLVAIDRRRPTAHLGIPGVEVYGARPAVGGGLGALVERDPSHNYQS